MKNRSIAVLPLLLTLLASASMLLHGPIPQLPHYHDFADQSSLFGMPHAADVLSNIGFAVVGLCGWLRLRTHSQHPAIASGWPGYRLFLAALILTAGGSFFYHLAPDDWRLIWDRLPIALACAGILAAVRAEHRPPGSAAADAAMLSILAVAGVAWWYRTGDLRPYLLLQALPIVLIPLWQTIYRAKRRDRLMFGIALMLYVAAKAAEVYDHQILATVGWISGHTMKHMLATAAAAALVARLIERIEESPAGTLNENAPHGCRAAAMLPAAAPFSKGGPQCVHAGACEHFARRRDQRDR